MKRITVAITGASGAIYALRTLRALLMREVAVDVVISEFGWMLLRDEAGFEGKQRDFGRFIRELYGVSVDNMALHPLKNLAATLASGSARSDGMVVVPCSMKTLASIAHGLSRNLIERAADVALKERRTLIVVPRETPMNLIQLRNMVAVAEAGAVVVPAMPAFYQKPETFDDLADFVVGRILSLLGIEHDLYPAWEGG
ncbi:MAG: UbiX family flavin prenyltransferase [Gemmatimonadetes bacterium]|nr:UbiX family flavin prenyltransferase [Gemmatimonadota bacterium]MYB57327.1 UbiX family flavin prenyltransferase [Gemmatimonadota bacterium]